MAAWSQPKLALPGTVKRRQIAGLTSSSVILSWYVVTAGAKRALEPVLALDPFFEGDSFSTAIRKCGLRLNL